MSAPFSSRFCTRPDGVFVAFWGPGALLARRAFSAPRSPLHHRGARLPMGFVRHGAMSWVTGRLEPASIRCAINSTVINSSLSKNQGE
jgi:hypothetical protein